MEQGNSVQDDGHMQVMQMNGSAGTKTKEKPTIYP